MQENDDRPFCVESLISDDSFVNYCFRENEEDCAYWEAWIRVNPDKQAQIDEAKMLVEALKDRPTDQEMNAAKERLLQALGLKVHASTKVRRLQTVRWAVAAAILLFCGLGAWHFFSLQKEQVGKAMPQLALATEIAPVGKVMHIRLADGTVVDLEPGSSLTYPEVFDGDSRVVTLNGDANFTVMPDRERPFVVQTGVFYIHVLGTTFHVQSFQSDRFARVALFEGQVQVHHQGKQYDMAAGQAFSYDRNSRAVDITPFDYAEEKQRMKGLLVFHQASYEEVGRRLARKYGIEYVPNDAIDMAFSGRISNEPIEEVIKKLNFATGYSFYLESNRLIAKQK